MFSTRGSLAYNTILAIGRDPKLIWNQIDDALRAMLLSRELALAAATSSFPSSRNFFEMIRVDFVLDEDLNVFIMEVIRENCFFFHLLPHVINPNFCRQT